jgi:hypothetical protein
MTARDEYKAKLVCPQCGRAGVAELSEENGYSYTFSNQATRVEALPEGFKKIAAPDQIGGIDLICTQCNVSAWK